jgi:signal transduction histidine kinase
MVAHKHDVMDEIYHSALRFSVPLNSHDTYPLIVSEAIKLMHAKSGSIFLPQGEGFIRAYASSPNLYDIQPSLLGKTKQTFDQNKIFVENYEVLVKKHPEYMKDPVGADLTAPFTYNNNAIGVLSLQSFPQELFSSDDLKKLELFMPLATLAFRKSQLHDDVQYALHFRDMFISMASHELKTPLTAVYSYAQLIQRETAKTDHRLQKYAENLINATLRMKKLVDELLTVDNMNNNELRYHMAESNIIKIVTRTVNEFSISHADIEIELENKVAEAEVTVMADYDKLIQVFTNILNNARKYSPKQSRIFVMIETDDTYAIVRIKDQGQGISQADLPHVFNPFYRGDTTRSEGKGLGLYLVKKIIEEHHGDVLITSQVGKGTQVMIKLPIYHN